MTEQLVNALKAIEALGEDTIFYRLHEGHIVSAIQALALGQSINLHSAFR